MLKLILPANLKQELLSELKRAGSREMGGVLMAEHTGTNEFTLREMTFHKLGTLASFIRRIEDALGQLRSFFDKTERNYSRFNYIGEWHSHPSFPPEPSGRDSSSMKEIILDPNIGANFVVLLIVKTTYAGELQASLHTYLPDGNVYRGNFVVR